MKTKRAVSRLVQVGVLALGFSLLVIPVANAYIDPGSGSFIFQMAVGAILGVGIAVRAFWGRLSQLFKRDKDATPPE